MHTYIKAKDEPLWTVGHYKRVCGSNTVTVDQWVPMKDYNTEAEAAAMVNHLNGGVMLHIVDQPGSAGSVRQPC